MYGSAQRRDEQGNALVRLLLYVIIIFLGFALYMGYTQGTENEFNTDDVKEFFYDIRDFMLGSPVDDVDNENLKPEAFSANIEIMDTTDKTVTIRILAQSKEARISKMKVWSKDRPPTEWIPFTKIYTVDLADFVYVRLRDADGNISDLYTKNTHSYKE